MQKPDEGATIEQPNQSPLVDLAKLNLLRTLVERIREQNEQQANMRPDGPTIAVLSVQPFHGPRSSEEADESHEPATIDDPADIPIQIHPPMMPTHHRGGGPRPFGPWPSDDYYTAPFYPDYQQYPDLLVDSFGPRSGHHNRPRPHHNGPPPPPFDAMEFSNGADQQYPDFAPEPFAAGPPPPFHPRGHHRGGPFNRPPPMPPMPDMGDYSDGPFGGRNGPPPPIGPFQGPPPSFGPFGRQEEPREEPSESQQPTIRITQHFADRNSDRPSAVVTEIFGGERMKEMVGEMFISNAMQSMNMVEQPQPDMNNNQLLPPWMKPQFGQNAVSSAFMQGSSPNTNPFLPVPNQMQIFNGFPGMQSPPGGMMNQFNSAPIEMNQPPFEMNLNQGQPMVQTAPFFHGGNHMQQPDPLGSFRPDMPLFMSQNGQNDISMPNQVFPMGDNQHQMASQPVEIGQGAAMFPPVMPPPEHQMRPEHSMFNAFESAPGPRALNQQPSEPSIDAFDPSAMHQNNGPRPVDAFFVPEVQHWNEEMLEKNQHRFQGMTPEMFAASLNLTPDMAPQPPTSEEEQQTPQQPQVAPAFGMDFNNDQGMFFSPPKPSSSAEDRSTTTTDDHPNVQPLPPNVLFHVDAPQDHGPPAVAPQEPAVPPQSQDIPQSPIWNHPLDQAQHPDTPMLSRSEGVADSK